MAAGPGIRLSGLVKYRKFVYTDKKWQESSRNAPFPDRKLKFSLSGIVFARTGFGGRSVSEKRNRMVEDIRRPESMQRIDTPELAKAFIEEQIQAVKEQVGDKKVLLALSGGVDSSVVAALLIKAIGDNLYCVHVNHGLLRKGEPEQVIEVFQNQMKANLIYVDATDRFLDLLKDVTDPETKRKIIGGEFINVFAEEARKLEGIEFLAQGTIWPDILES